MADTPPPGASSPANMSAHADRHHRQTGPPAGIWAGPGHATPSGIWTGLGRTRRPPAGIWGGPGRAPPAGIWSGPDPGGWVEDGCAARAVNVPLTKRVVLAEGKDVRVPRGLLKGGWGWWWNERFKLLAEGKDVRALTRPAQGRDGARFPLRGGGGWRSVPMGL
eukprot:scaffold26137_cov73-Isochrysis_galbana.AAC.1